jgi:hypothetical protein
MPTSPIALKGEAIQSWATRLKTQTNVADINFKPKDVVQSLDTLKAYIHELEALPEIREERMAQNAAKGVRTIARSR